MRFAFIVDPIHKLKAYKDSSVFMMREAAQRGHEVWTFEARDMFVDGAVSASAVRLEVSQSNDAWYTIATNETRPLTGFDAVLMRKDPPFDQEYLYATLLLSLAEQ